ncbi:class I SAM-dependent methyltransferase [Actinomadura madurae]|uniref:class I SAM-dependent methyltransferase n=1 Tax=Actinomadura madurae TaxID=1993 RepID=UPI00399B381D
MTRRDFGAAVTGTPADPHAQARAAREQPLLLHSMSVFRELFQTIFGCREIATVVEVGVESGQVSSVYADLGATVHCVEPAPGDDLRAFLAEDPRLNLVEGLSPAVLPDLPAADLYVLDGDHNHAVVRAELAWIMANAPDAVVVLHDVLWPCGRRDFYYQPSPLEETHPSTTDGPTAWHDDLTPAGFVGDGAYTVAAHAGGPRNGVLTAVEDALDDAPGWRFAIVPAVFGFGVLIRTGAPGADAVFDALRPYTSSTCSRRWRTTASPSTPASCSSSTRRRPAPPTRTASPRPSPPSSRRSPASAPPSTAPKPKPPPNTTNSNACVTSPRNRRHGPSRN